MFVEIITYRAVVGMRASWVRLQNGVSPTTSQTDTKSNTMTLLAVNFRLNAQHKIVDKCDTMYNFIHFSYYKLGQIWLRFKIQLKILTFGFLMTHHRCHFHDISWPTASSADHCHLLPELSSGSLLSTLPYDVSFHLTELPLPLHSLDPGRWHRLRHLTPVRHTIGCLPEATGPPPYDSSDPPNASRWRRLVPRQWWLFPSLPKRWWGRGDAAWQHALVLLHASTVLLQGQSLLTMLVQPSRLQWPGPSWASWPARAPQVAVTCLTLEDGSLLCRLNRREVTEPPHWCDYTQQCN